jgi:hypothetical protein
MARALVRIATASWIAVISSERRAMLSLCSAVFEENSALRSERYFFDSASTFFDVFISDFF